MTDDGRWGPMDELGELLSTADGPLHFPEPRRRELLDQVTRTASMPRHQAGTTVVPFPAEPRAASGPRRSWAIGVAASLLIVVVVAVAVVTGRGDAPSVPADRPLPVPMTVDEVCEQITPLLDGNGLGDRSVQLGDVSRVDIDDVARLLARLGRDADGPVDQVLIDDATTRLQLMAISIDTSDNDAAVAAMNAARASIGAVIDGAC